MSDWPTLSNCLRVFTNTKSCTGSSKPLIEKVKLSEAVLIKVHRSGCSGGYWSAVIFLYLLPFSAAHTISCSAAVLAGESGGERINEKWALHKIYISIIHCNIHLSLLPRAWRHARFPKRARTKAPHTRREANYVRLLIIFLHNKRLFIKKGTKSEFSMTK